VYLCLVRHWFFGVFTRYARSWVLLGDGGVIAFFYRRFVIMINKLHQHMLYAIELVGSVHHSDRVDSFFSAGDYQGLFWYYQFILGEASDSVLSALVAKLDGPAGLSGDECVSFIHNYFNKF
jgi:hypothetical protein